MASIPKWLIITMCQLAMICFWYLIAPWKASGFFLAHLECHILFCVFGYFLEDRDKLWDRVSWKFNYKGLGRRSPLLMKDFVGLKNHLVELWNLTCGLLGFAEAITNRCGNFLGCIVLWIVTGNKNPICWMSYSCSLHCNLDHNQQYQFGKTGLSLSMVASYKAYLYYRFT